MSNKIYKKVLSIVVICSVALFSCTKDLEKSPTNGVTDAIQYSTVAGYKQSLASLYASFVYGPSGGFLRYYWDMQEYTTDEAVPTWNDDGGVPVYHNLAWGADLPAVANVYGITLNIITLCNNFILESSDGNLAKRGFSTTDLATIHQYVAEARFLRAYSYWVLMDEYGNPPNPTEKTLLVSVPKQIQRSDLFAYIESELKAIDPILTAPKANESGRADQAAEWSLLARMYLNAQVYTGTARFTDAITYSSKVINAGYTLVPSYGWLMLGDNSQNTNEFIYTINYNNSNTIVYDGTNYLVLGQAGTTAAVNGLSGSWNEFRFTQSIPALFPTKDTSVDKRAQFYTTGQNLNVVNMASSTDGYSSFKYRNKTRTGAVITQNNSVGSISDIDFPVFRLGETYLIYAEAVLRGGTGGSSTSALGYINQLRGRAYASNPSSTMGNITQAQLTTDFILDERARELYWEGQRRTDLIRYGKLTTGTYLWAWKGGVLAGTAVDSKYNLFPIPTSDLLANPNLKQNPGY